MNNISDNDFVQLVSDQNEELFHSICLYVRDSVKFMKTKDKNNRYKNEYVRKICSVFNITIDDCRNVKQRDEDEISEIYIVYARVSTKLQTDSNSIACQLDMMKNVLLRRNLEYVNLYNISEYSSAYSKIPPRLKYVLDIIPDKSTLIVAYHDRLSRNIDTFRGTIAPLFLSKNMRVIIASENGESGSDVTFHHSSYEVDTLIMTQKLISGHLESALKGQRGRRTNKYLKDNNIAYRRKFGYDIVNKEYIPNVYEQQAIALINYFRLDIVLVHNANKLMQLIWDRVMPDEMYESFNFYINNNRMVNQISEMDFSDIASLFNEYSVPYINNKPWTAAIVKSIYMRDFLEEDNMVVEEENSLSNMFSGLSTKRKNNRSSSRSNNSVDRCSSPSSPPNRYSSSSSSPPPRTKKSKTNNDVQINRTQEEDDLFSNMINSTRQSRDLTPVFFRGGNTGVSSSSSVNKRQHILTPQTSNKKARNSPLYFEEDDMDY
jgi:DNA invertase Pin-like site-specific DNA recombinase